MRYRLPSLNALRAFEAVGRHGTVTAAAHELQVTPGAVSRQIALLEGHFDCRLFDRQRRGLVLSGRGKRYFQEISQVFERIDTASRQLEGCGRASPLSVRVYTTFATDWLIPRLPQFRARHPSIELRLDASLRDVDFASEDIDAGLVRSDRIPPGSECTTLFRPLMFPVAGAALVEAGPPLEQPSDLVRHTLLYSSIQRRNWLVWLKAARVPRIDLERGLFFENSSLTYRAAREGAGVALGQRLFLAEDLLAGRLVAPFDLTLRSAHSYMLAVPARRRHDPQVIAFRDWLVESITEAEQRASRLLGHLEASAADPMAS